MRIISLVPSLTELLCDLGLESQIVGITKFCIHPENLLKEKVVIGGTKNFRFQIIDDLYPDLIIANKEENYQEGIEYLLKKNYKVLLTDIYSYEDALNAILDIGKITGKEDNSLDIVNRIIDKFTQLPKISAHVIYLIWQNPILTAGKNTFIDSMLSKIGMKNAIIGNRYPEIDENILKNLKPNYLFLSTEPFPFKDRDINYYKELLPNTKVILVDGEMFSWYGSRMIKAPQYFKEIFLI